MKALVIGGGASWSLADVDKGVIAGLRAAGVEVGEYAYDARIGAWSRVLRNLWLNAKRHNPQVEKPTFVRVQINAMSEAQMIAQLNEADWLVIVSGMFVPLPLIKAWRRYCRIPIALLLTESPYDTDQEVRWAEHAHLVWTNERTVVERLRGVNAQVRYLPHAWLPGVHDVAPANLDEVPAHDVVFVGSAFKERIAFLEAIDWSGIDLGLYGQWKQLARRSPLRAFLRAGVVSNALANGLYRRAKVGLNLYRQTKGWTGVDRVDRAESLNPRAYELAAAGCFQVSDARAEVHEIFGGTVPTISTPIECEAVIRRALMDPAWRRHAATVARERVAGQTWIARGQQMVADLQRASRRTRRRTGSLSEAA